MASLGGPTVTRKRRYAELGASGLSSASGAPGGSLLARHLMSELAWGAMSPQQVQVISMLCIKDMQAGRLRDVELLARAGSGGAYANNVHRDMYGLVKAVSRFCFMSTTWSTPYSQSQICKYNFDRY